MVCCGQAGRPQFAVDRGHLDTTHGRPRHANSRIRDWILPTLLRRSTAILALALAWLLSEAVAQSVEITRVGQWPGYQRGEFANAVAVSENYAYIASQDDGVVVVDISDPAKPAFRGSCDALEAAGGVAVAGSYAYVAAGNSGLQVVDIRNPAKPELLGGCDTPGYAQDVALAGDYAYVADRAGLQVFDVRTPAKTVWIGKCDSSGAHRIALAGSYAYLADWEGLNVIDVRNPAKPVSVGKYNGSVVDVAVSGSHVYTAESWWDEQAKKSRARLGVIDVSNPSNPVRTAGFEINGSATCVAVAGEFAYLADDRTGLEVISIRDPLNPIWIGSCVVAADASSVVVSGNYAFVTGSGFGLRIIDARHPTDPVEVGTCNTAGFASSVAVSEGVAYVADSFAGLDAIDVRDPALPVRVGGYRPTGGMVSDVAVSGSYCYLVDIGGVGLTIVDIHDSANPVKVSDTSGGEMGVRMALQGNYAYVAAEVMGFMVFDIHDPTRPVHIGGYDWGPSPALDVAVSAGFAYVVVEDVGLAIFDVHIPAHPSLVCTYSNGSEYPSWGRGIKVVGNYAYLSEHRWDAQTSSSKIRFNILDVSNPLAPVQIGGCDIPALSSDIEVSGNYAYVASGDAGLQVIDVRDPAKPVWAGGYNTPGTAAGVLVSGNYVYVADGSWGLQILRIGPPGTIQGTVAASPTSAVADGESAVTVTVTLQDGNGQPLTGKTVKVSALGTTVGVSITQPAAPTDANGRATATLTSLAAGTVLIAATDVTDGIPLSQQAQQPLVTFTANLVLPNADLRQAIGSLFENTVAWMKANAGVGSDAGKQGDVFRANVIPDLAGAVLDGLLGIASLASGVSQSAKFAGLLAEPRLAETGAGPLITDSAKLSYLFDSELIHGEFTSRVLESVFRSVLATALKKSFIKLGVEGIKDGLRQIAAQDDGLSQLAESARKNVDLFEQSLQQRKEPLLSQGIPPLSTAQQTAWANDLDRRGQTAMALYQVLSQQDHFLQQFTAARGASSADAFEWFLQKLVVQTTATVLFDGPGALVTGGMFLVLDERQDMLNLSSDLTGYQMAFSTLGGVVQRNNELYLNAASGYTELAQARLARPVTGEVGPMSDVEEGHAWKLLGLVPKFSVANAYSEVNIRNTSSADATFEVFVLWGYASSAFNVSIPDLAQVSIGVARIPAQAEAPISILYKNGSHGAEPDAATTMTVFVLGNNESGTFYVGQLSHNWNPTQKEAVEGTLAKSGLYSSVRPMDDSGPTNALPAMENPVNVYVTQDAESQTYQGRIFVVNPFGQSYYAVVTQTLPTGATVLTTDGALSNSTIVWTNSIAAGGLAKDSFTFRLPLNPGAATNLAPVLVTFTDTAGTSEPLASDEADFTGLFPVQLSGSVPLGTPGTNATMLVTVTNLTAFAQSGTLTLTLTNAALAFGTNLVQPFTVTTASATNLDFALPGDVPAGQYAVTGLLSMNGGSGQVLTGVYTMPPRPFSLNLGPAPVWGTNGLSLALAGPVGSNYLIQASTDLANWMPVRYFAITNSPFYFNDATATNSGARFYRAVIP